MNRPKVGVGVYIIKDNTLLMGLRKGTHGEGDWCPPGGHLEAGESWEKCAMRETEEESGLIVKNVRLGTVTNDIFEKDDKHYITIAMVADYAGGEPERLEPNKCLEWRWFTMDDLPENLFVPVKNAFEQGFNPFSQEIQQYNRMLASLDKIANKYYTVERLRKCAGSEYGLDPDEVVEMAYENIQEEAKFAIQGLLPKGKK